MRIAHLQRRVIVPVETFYKRATRCVTLHIDKNIHVNTKFYAQITMQKNTNAQFKEILHICARETTILCASTDY